MLLQKHNSFQQISVKVPAQKEQGLSEQQRFTILVVDNVIDLRRHISDWEDLAHFALEPNVFYEPWMILPALKAFGAKKHLQFVLVFASDPRTGLEGRILCGFFPLERLRWYKGLPIRAVRLWQYLHCFLCTPLLRVTHAREVLVAFFEWLSAERPRPLVFECEDIGGEGAVAQTFAEYFHVTSRVTFISNSFSRPLFRPRMNGDAYLDAAYSHGHRRKLRQKERQLSRAGHLEHTFLKPGDNVDKWVDEFLRLEASGWKGRQGTALALHEAEKQFLIKVTKEAFRRGRLMMLALAVDGQHVAQKCNFLAGPGSFAFKIAYDEKFSRFSPGILLEMDNVHALHAGPEIQWMDSCASSDEFYRWLDRRSIQTILISSGSKAGDLVVRLFPLLRWLERIIWRSMKASRTWMPNRRLAERPPAKEAEEEMD